MVSRETQARGPGRRRTTAGNRWTGPSFRTQTSVTMARSSGPRSRRAQASPLLCPRCWMGRHPPFPNRREVRRNRRAPGASVGGKHGCDERSRSEPTGFPPVVGDRKIADVSAVNLGNEASRRPQPLGVLGVLAVPSVGWTAFVSLCLRVCAVLCVRALCLCASVVRPMSSDLRW